MTAAPPDTLAEVVQDLDTVVELGPGRLDDDHVVRARTLRRGIDERLAVGDGVTVVAVAGGTGVGKSALVNRLVDAPVAREGVRRPTTAVALAATAATTDPATTAVLDWLEVPDRRSGLTSLPDGLVLLDLPDHDSVAEDHHVIAGRLRRRADAVVVVTDPLKYAREDLHTGALAELLAHAEVTIVVLNRVDELDGEGLRSCLADLRARLDGEGHRDTVLLATSARTGEGVADLRDRLVALATDRRAARRRLAGDAALFAAAALPTVPDPVEVELTADTLTAPLLDATDAHRAAEDAGVAYRRDARRSLRSPVARVARAPFGLAARFARDLGVGDRPRPERRPDLTPRVEGTLARELGLAEATGRGHAVLDRTIARTAAGGARSLVDAVRSVPLAPDRRWWWAPLSWLRGAAETVALVGLVWSVLLGVSLWLQLPPVPTPHVTDDVSWPAALLLGGLAARVLLGVVSRLATASGAAAHRRGVAGRLRAAVVEVVERRLLPPFRDEVAAQRRLRASLQRLAVAADPAGRRAAV